MVYKNRVDGKMPINSIYRTADFVFLKSYYVGEQGIC